MSKSVSVQISKADRVNSKATAMTSGLLKSIAGDRRTEQVKLVLTQLARELGPNAKLPTTRSLRKSMQVSQTTLDAALEMLEDQGLIHRRQGSGIYASQEVRAHRIALVFGQRILEGHAESFHHHLFKVLRQEAKRRNVRLSYYFHASDPEDDEHGSRQLAMDAQSGRVEALMIIGMTPWQLGELEALRLPSVYLSADTSRKSRVYIDNPALIVEGVRQLAVRGCRQIAYTYPDFANHPNASRYPDFIGIFGQTMSQVGLSVDNSWLIPFDPDNNRTRPLEASSRIHELWRSRAVKPDGLLSTDDQYTSGVVHAARMLGIRIPEDLIMVSHSNRGMNLFDDAQIIRLEFDTVELAQGLLNAVDELLEPGATVTEVRIVRPQVILPDAAPAQTMKCEQYAASTAE